LLSQGADVDATEGREGSTPLHFAAKYCEGKDNTKFVELLLNKNCAINAKDRHGRTALQIASNNQHTFIEDLLRRHGAE
jgi:ankyrin repeat protein